MNYTRKYDNIRNLKVRCKNALMAISPRNRGDIDKYIAALEKKVAELEKGLNPELL